MSPKAMSVFGSCGVCVCVCVYGVFVCVFMVRLCVQIEHHMGDDSFFQCHQIDFRQVYCKYHRSQPLFIPLPSCCTKHAFGLAPLSMKTT